MPPGRSQNIGVMQVGVFRNNETKERCQRLEANGIEIPQSRSTTSQEEPIPSVSGERQLNRRSNVTMTYERLEFRYDATVDNAGVKSVDFRIMTPPKQFN